MANDIVLVRTQGALLTILFASGPAIMAALVIGVLVGLAQALTQIQDQSLPQTIKLVAIMIVVLLFGPLLGHQIVEQASTALDEFPIVTR